MRYKYTPKGVCSTQINIDMDENDVIKSIEFVGGCPGNTTGVAKLAVGRKVDEIISLLKGVPCRNRGTSCPDQLARALEEYKSNK